MQNKPDIKRAIPQRRYKYGEFEVVLLGDIESGDEHDYRYIIAVVREGESLPGLYLTCERTRPGSCPVRLIMRDGVQLLADDARLQDEEVFCATGLDVISQVLNLGDEEPYRLQ